MIALDTNILVYAHREDADHHIRARSLLKGLAEGDEPWALPWPCIYEFIRVVTHPRVFDPPSDLDLAVSEIVALSECPSLTLIGEGLGHLGHLRRMVLGGRAAGNVAHDAHIAALVVEHGVRELWTTDRDFSRFPGLRVRDPFSGWEVHESRATRRATVGKRRR